MPTVINRTVTLYQFNELDDSAKEKAMQWWRSCMDTSDYADHVIEDATTIAELLGVEFDTRPVKLYGGGTRQEPKVYWSGFSSQGDGASFEGRYRYNKGAKVSSHVGGDSDSTKELLRIEKQLRAIQRRYFYQIEAKITTSGNYSHSHSMDFEFEVGDGSRWISDTDERDLKQLLRDFADWIYRQLEAEYDYQSSKEQIADAMEANQYTFDEQGNRED